MNDLFRILNELKRNVPVYRPNPLHSCPALFIAFGKRRLSFIESYDKGKPEWYKREKQAYYDPVI